LHPNQTTKSTEKKNNLEINTFPTWIKKTDLSVNLAPKLCGSKSPKHPLRITESSKPYFVLKSVF
jgi:hypothetical protein